MSLHVAELDRAMNKLGMRVKDTKDRHYYFYVNDRLILGTKRSFGNKPLGGAIPNLIRRQLRLRQNEFSELIACPLGRDGYIEILRERGHLTPT